MAQTKTWSYKDLNVTFNGAAITDINGDLTITADGDFWEFVEGQNGYVERSLVDNHLATVTIPLHATSPQLNIFAIASIADRKANAGPYIFTAIDKERNYKLIGTATVMNIGKPSRSKSAQARTVTLKVVTEAEYDGL